MSKHIIIPAVIGLICAALHVSLLTAFAAGFIGAGFDHWLEMGGKK